MAFYRAYERNATTILQYRNMALDESASLKEDIRSDIEIWIYDYLESDSLETNLDNISKEWDLWRDFLEYLVTSRYFLSLYRFIERIFVEDTDLNDFSIKNRKVIISYE